MLISGWIFFASSWTLIIILTVYCFYKTLQSDGKKTL